MWVWPHPGDYVHYSLRTVCGSLTSHRIYDSCKLKGCKTGRLFEKTIKFHRLQPVITKAELSLHLFYRPWVLVSPRFWTSSGRLLGWLSNCPNRATHYVANGNTFTTKITFYRNISQVGSSFQTDWSQWGGDDTDKHGCNNKSAHHPHSSQKFTGNCFWGFVPIPEKNTFYYRNSGKCISWFYYWLPRTFALVFA